MSVSSIAVPTTSTTAATSAQHAHHAHGKRSAGGSSASSTKSATPGSPSTSASQSSTANESLQQRANQGDPIAIAELKAETPQPPKAGQDPAAQGAQQHRGATEPGKGEEVDVYA